MAKDLIQITSGSITSVDKLRSYEPGYVVAEEELYIGTPGGPKKMTSKKEVGSVAELNTVDKSSLVKAVNEVRGGVLDLAGIGRTTETLKGVSDSLVSFKAENTLELTLKASTDYVDTKIATVASGSPKGVYATLIDLETALPTGDTGIYLVTTDGEWYYWNSASWVSGGIYQGSGIADGSVTRIKADFMKVGVNLFNEDDVTDSFFARSDTGVLQASATYSVSDFIPVTAETAYILSSIELLPFYDSSKVFISGLSQATLIAADGKFTTPVGAAYVRVNTLTANLAIQQLELGSIKSSYVSYDKFFIEPDVIKTSDFDVLVNATTLSGTVGKVVNILDDIHNLFNKSTATSGKFAKYTDGTLGTNASYTVSDYIPITAETPYTINFNEQVAFYNSSKVFISGLSQAQLITSKGLLTSPVSAVFIRVNTLTVNLSAFVFMQIDYVPPVAIPDGYLVKKANIIIPKGFIEVAKRWGDFSSIVTAIANANDSVNNPVTIKIYPGTYYERILVPVGRYISLIGVNKLSCIIRDDTAQYPISTLDYRGIGRIEGLSIINTYDDLVDPVLQDLYAYAVHLDYEGAGDVELFNCLMKSNTSAAVGIGLHQDQSIKIDNCEMYAYTDVGVSHTINGALLCHSGAGADVTGQKFEARNSLFRSVNNKVVSITDDLSSGDVGMDVTFIGNTGYCDQNGITNVVSITAKTTGNLSGKINLTPWSHGNNLVELNA